MSLLTDTSITRLLTTNKDEWMQNDRIQNQKLLIARYNEQSLTPVGYDLRVGDIALKMHRKFKARVELKKEGDELTILPDEIVAIRTDEYIGMPQNKKYSGIIVSKVSLGEMGLSHISTSIDADWKGELIITITNHSKRKIILRRGQPLCTMILFKNEFPATKPCEKDPHKHLTILRESWESIRKTTRKVLCFKLLLKIFIPLSPLIWLFYRYTTATITEAEAVLFVALSSVLYWIIDSTIGE